MWHEPASCALPSLTRNRIPVPELHPLVARDRKGTPTPRLGFRPLTVDFQPTIAAYLANVQDEDAAGDLLAAPADRLRAKQLTDPSWIPVRRCGGQDSEPDLAGGDD
mgnify:CR=1 FL=1